VRDAPLPSPFELEVEVQAPPSAVFELLADPRSQAGLHPLVAEVRELERTRDAAGRELLRFEAVERLRILGVLPLRNPLRVACTLVEPGREITFTAESRPAVRVEARFRLSPRDGATEVREELRLRAPFGLRRLVRREALRAHRALLSNLKRRAEEAAARRLETPRLHLHPCAQGDQAELHRLFRDPQVRRFLWDDREIEESTTSSVIEDSTRSFAARGFGQWLLRERAGGGVVGFCGLRPVDEGPEIEILYGLWPSQWKRGLAGEAARTVLAHAFGALGLERVAGRVDTPNQASARVLERLGMHFEGERLVHGRPTLHYGISRADFLRSAG
jgi:ribosomal-protein-alanine N-acetyltransferase